MKRNGPSPGQLTRGQILKAKEAALLTAARAYVSWLETGRNPAPALNQLGAAAVEHRAAERAAKQDGRLSVDADELDGRIE